MTTASSDLRCSDCQTPAEESYKFCGACGAAIVRPAVPEVRPLTAPPAPPAAPRQRDDLDDLLDRQHTPAPPQGPSLALPILFGFIGAYIAATKAKRRGIIDTSRYWVAALISTIVGILLTVVAAVAIPLMLVSAAENADGGSGGTGFGAAATTTYSAPTTVVSLGDLVNAWTIDEQAAGGYTFEAVLRTGAPRHVTPGLGLGTLIAGAGCSDLSAQTDAVIPAEISLQNTTPSFSAMAAVRFSFSSSWANAEMEAQYSDGPTCNTSQDQGFGLQSTQPLLSNQSTTLYAFLVLHNYYTPAAPEGDPAVLASATLIPIQAHIEASNATLTITNVSGPGYSSDTGIPVGAVGPASASASAGS
jgi:hypothetical protein